MTVMGKHKVKLILENYSRFTIMPGFPDVIPWKGVCTSQPKRAEPQMLAIDAGKFKAVSVGSTIKSASVYISPDPQLCLVFLVIVPRVGKNKVTVSSPNLTKYCEILTTLLGPSH